MRKIRKNTKKKIGILFAFLLGIGALAGCGDTGNAASRVSGSNAAGVFDVLEEGMAEADANAESSIDAEEELNSVYDDVVPEPEIEDKEELLSMTEGIDVDLTTLSSTMVYSEVYSMMYEPEDFVGKTIRMDGFFNTYHDDETAKDYFACIIQDATACCAQGVEFILTDDYSYPDDYPESGDWITVTGVFDTYVEGDYTYCTLRDATMKF